MAELRALTVREAKAYLAGVLAGDGFLSGRRRGRPDCFGLLAADLDFTEAFAEALNIAYADTARPRISGGYWVVRRANTGDRFSELRTFEAVSITERGAWLRGFFDSDGNVSLVPKPQRGPRSWTRRVSFYKTDLGVLGMAIEHLNDLGIPNRSLRKVANLPGHYGTKQVYELAIRSSKASHAAFAQLVGSSLERKRTVLDAIPASYSDRSTTAREAGARGAATKRARAMNERLPRLLQSVAAHVASGGGATHGELRRLDGYFSARQTLGYSHAQIVEWPSAAGRV